MPGIRYAPGLDGIRALAVLAVVAYHLGVTGAGAHPLPAGFLGVDVFFVLSGYLITALLAAELDATGTVSLRRFYLRRARRLLPALAALLLVVAVVAAYVAPELAARVRGELLAALGYASNWWLVGTGGSYFAGAERPSPLEHLWSLAVEGQYYLVWPLVLVGLARLRVGRRVTIALVAAGVAASTLAGVLLYDPFADPSRVYFGTDTRALAPLLGAALALWLRPWRRPAGPAAPRRRALDVAGVAALVTLAGLAALPAAAGPWLFRGGLPLVAALAAVAVAAAGHPATRLGRALARQPLRYLGERSYGIYLWHWPVDVLTRPGLDLPVTGLASVALRAGLTLALAELSYRLVELPLRRAARHRRAAGPGRVLRPGLAVPALAAALAAVVAGVGLAAAGPRPAGPPVDTAGPQTRLELGLDPGAGRASRGGAGTAAAVPGGPRVAVFGDSQGLSLLTNRPPDLDRYVQATDATIEGCGILLGRITSRSGERRDLTAGCGSWHAAWAVTAHRLRPDVAVVMIGAWDVFDVTTPTGTLAFGTPGWDAYFLAQLGKGTAVLRAAGATVALALLPCYRPVRSDAEHWPERGDDGRTRHVNDLLRRAAAADRAGLRLLEPPAEFCTDRSVATSQAHRFDGVHYARPGAALYLRTVVPQLLAIGG